MKPMERPLSVACGASMAGARTALVEAGFHVLVTGEEAPDPDGLAEGPPRFVLVRAEAVGPDLAGTVGRLAAVPDTLTVVVGSDPSPHQVVAAMRAGAADYVATDSDGRYLRDLPQRLRRLAAAADGASPQGLADRFVQVMAAVQHDVKNPIHNIMGYVELLTDSPGSKLSRDQAQFLQRITANCTTVLEVLETFTRETARITGKKRDV